MAEPKAEPLKNEKIEEKFMKHKEERENKDLTKILCDISRC